MKLSDDLDPASITDAQSQAQPVTAETHEERSEKSYKAAAHNPGNTPEGRLHAAEKLAELHEERTGERIDPQYEASIGDAKAEERDRS
ncbi:2317_t:CDS:2 [Diversispora eburnea]|uniref:2317_t:CDS:1 n=1 Tax=Diversispora eburnea TaxID=1213867 RepID=A0A9N9AX95_9GLOM|nr:2317_t:CDS:2 [Diversispora eburnea]